MQLRAFALILAVGCGSKGDGNENVVPPPSARASVTDPIGFCERAERVIIRRKKCFAEDVSLKMALDEVRDYFRKAPADPDERIKTALLCAKMLDGMSKAEQPALCPLDMLDEEREELAAFLAKHAPPKEKTEVK